MITEVIRRGVTALLFRVLNLRTGRAIGQTKIAFL